MALTSTRCSWRSGGPPPGGGSSGARWAHWAAVKSVGYRFGAMVNRPNTTLGRVVSTCSGNSIVQALKKNDLWDHLEACRATRRLEKKRLRRDRLKQARDRLDKELAETSDI